MKYVNAIKTRPIDLDIHGTKIRDVYLFVDALKMAGDSSTVVCLRDEGGPFQELVAFERGDDKNYDMYYRMQDACFYIMPNNKLFF